MSKYLLIAAALLLLGSTGLSFANKGKLTASLEDAKGAHTEAQAARQDATKARTALTKAQGDMQLANQGAKDATLQLDSIRAQVAELNAKYEAATKAAQDKDAQLAVLNKQLTDAMGKGNTTDPNAPSIAQQIEDLKRQRDELQVVKDGLDTQLKVAQNQVATSAKREQDRKLGLLMTGIRGRVLAVDRNWNFVVLDLGDRNGVINNATMIIQRGDSLVGKVKITSVEPSQSIADIIPNSVPPGVSVQAGDAVVFPGT